MLNLPYILRADVWQLIYPISLQLRTICAINIGLVHLGHPVEGLLWKIVLLVSHSTCSALDMSTNMIIGIGTWRMVLRPRTTGFQSNPALSAFKSLFDISDSQAHRNFKRTDLDQTASREASLDMFRRFSRWRGPTLRTFIKANSSGRMLRWRYWWG